MEHSELPWFAKEKLGETIAIRDENGTPIAYMTYSFTIPASAAEANAAFIVEACNNYDALLIANKELREALENIKWVLQGEITKEAIENLKNYINRVLSKQSDGK